MHLVVVGGVAAGMSAASRARRLDSSLTITVLEAGPVVSYGACGLPYWIGGAVTRPDEQLIVHTPEFFERERKIRVRINTAVREIAVSRRRILLANGEELLYDRAVIATGARARRIPIEGADLGHCFTLRTWEDAHAIQRFLENNKPDSAAIVGAGYVGLEMAEALQARGLRVHVFDRSRELLGWGDAWLTELIATRLAATGTGLRLGHEVREITETAVDDVPAQLVILAPGIEPAVDLAESAGIRLGRSGAIAVDPLLETSVPGIFAAGDCAETYHRLLDAPAWLPLGTTANKMGRIAGANAAGRRERFPGVVGTSIVRVAGLAVGVTGLSEPAARQAGFSAVSVSVSATARARYFGGKQLEVKLVADKASGRLLGGAVLGLEDVAGKINVIATALTAAVTVEELQFLDLCYAPPYATVWDPILIAAQQLVKQLQ